MLKYPYLFNEILSSRIFILRKLNSLLIMDYEYLKKL